MLHHLLKNDDLRLRIALLLPCLVPFVLVLNSPASLVTATALLATVTAVALQIPLCVPASSSAAL